jgi:CheY-like chemotaxis protein
MIGNMIKIMLVEDDKSLREIYGVRLLAEGYDIVSAGDGEQALAVAIKERPALIITDVMMPKISGFDMLDILRSTTETRTIKVIVMTALGSDEQRIRGEQLGADRYLVKSQVGIEDVVRTVHEVLGDRPAAAPQPLSAPVPQRVTAPAANRAPAPSLPRPTQAPDLRAPVATAATAPIQAAPTPPQPQRPIVPPVTPPSASTTPTLKNRVIQPLNDPTVSRININELLDKELAKEAGIDMENRPAVASTQQEKAMVQNQLNDFTPPPTPPAPTPVAPQTQTPTNAATPIVPTPTTPPSNQATPQPTIQIGSDGKVTMPDSPVNTSNQPPSPPPPVR